MATTSGTTTFNLDLAQLVEEAFERCGSEMRSGYDLRTARRSLNLMFADWANRGLNMWTFEQGQITLELDAPSYALPADTVDLMEVYLRTNSGEADQQDIPLTRISQSNYAALPYKNQGGRPSHVLVRRVGTPAVLLWPVPDVSTYSLVYWRLRRIQDAGNGANVQDVPFRFLPAMAAGLAYYLALKIPGALERLPILKAEYDSAWLLAADEDREKASIRLVPAKGR